MSHNLSEIIKRVKKWPDWRQDDAAYLLQLMEENGTSPYRLSDEERFAVREGLESEIASEAVTSRFRERHQT